MNDSLPLISDELDLLECLVPLDGARLIELGCGGGFVIVPALERRTNLDLRGIQATSLAVIALVAVSGLGAAAWHGQLAAADSLLFAAGALSGLLVGRRASRHLPLQRLRQLFAVTAMCVALLLLLRAWA